MPRVVRKQKPPVLTDYPKYKPFLRLDFERRCAYCHIPESRNGPPGNYAVDHLRPKSKFPQLIADYSNLYYACHDCNRCKGPVWPAPKLAKWGFRFLDPCRDNLARHWTVTGAGELVPRSRAAEYMIARLHLNRQFLMDWRAQKAALTERIHKLDAMLALAKGDSGLEQQVRQLKRSMQAERAHEFAGFWQ